MITRREFIAGSLVLSATERLLSHDNGTIVNDIHSQLNETRVLEVLQPQSLAEVQAVVRRAAQERKAIAIAGGRHAMGGQQFATDALLIDVRKMSRVLSLDREHGILEVEAGIQWPELITDYIQRQSGSQHSWGIAQKQTGADRLTIAGTMAANAHGRGLKLRPFIGDVDSFVIVDASGTALTCSRKENAELFALVIGGYGLFGIVTSVRLRLAPRRKLERVVEIRTTDGLVTAFDERISEGFLYGDFQFAVERDSDDFLRRGVFSCYRPVPIERTVKPEQKELSDENWRRLLYLAHADPHKAFELYSNYYLSTNGQIYWSDTHQLSIYPDNYHREVDRLLHAPYPGSEIITEIDVPRASLKDFLDEVRDDFRKNKVDLIYGTVRLIERDDESFLPWAKQAYACTVFNLHTVHSPDGIAHSADAFRRLIDMAIKRGGTYYLTYHRFASRQQLEKSYPEFAEFLRLKKKYDPEERFQSDWYRHYQRMF